LQAECDGNVLTNCKYNTGCNNIISIYVHVYMYVCIVYNPSSILLLNSEPSLRTEIAQL